MPNMISNDIPLVSVVMDCFNHEKYLHDAISGVLAQKTNFPYEVILHDDASTDSSADIISHYASLYPSTIRPILQSTNQYRKPGVSIFQDFELPVVKGEFIAFCECDDYWVDDHRLQKAVDYLRSHSDCAAVYQNCVIVDEYGRQCQDLAKLKCCYRIWQERNYSGFDFATTGIFPGQTAGLTIRSSCYKALGGSALASRAALGVNGDTANVVTALAFGSIHVLPDISVAHRVVVDKGDSWTARTSGKNIAGDSYVGQLALRKWYKNLTHRCFWNYGPSAKTGIIALLRVLRDPTNANTQQAKRVVASTGNSGICALKLLSNYLIGLPIEVFWKMRRIINEGKYFGTLCFDSSVDTSPLVVDSERQNGDAV